jgi:hypothetical protein
LHRTDTQPSHRTDTQPAHNQPHCTDTDVDGFRSLNGLVDPSKQAVYAPAEGMWVRVWEKEEGRAKVFKWDFFIKYECVSLYVDACLSS